MRDEQYNVSGNSSTTNDLSPLVTTTLYPFLDDLLALDHCRAMSPISKALLGPTTLLNVAVWVTMLARLADQAFTHYITRGLHDGFQIGANREYAICSPTLSCNDCLLRIGERNQVEYWSCLPLALALS